MHHLLLGSGDPTGPWVSVAGAGALMTAVGLLARRFLSSTRDQYKALVKPAYERVAAVEAENARLEREKELLIGVLRMNGIPVPSEVLR